MPSRWTFSIPPIKEFIERHLPKNIMGDLVIVDPFCGQSLQATHANDLTKEGGIDAVEFVNKLESEGVRADCVLFDPPYSPRQISECYKRVGREVGMKETQNGSLYKNVKEPLARILKPGGVSLSFGWWSTGILPRDCTTEVLLVQHGGAHNDTICVCQIKPLQEN
jgi:hypothetical protein